MTHLRRDLWSLLFLSNRIRRPQSSEEEEEASRRRVQWEERFRTRAPPRGAGSAAPLVRL